MKYVPAGFQIQYMKSLAVGYEHTLKILFIDTSQAEKEVVIHVQHIDSLIMLYDCTSLCPMLVFSEIEGL